MIEYKTGVEVINWESLTQLYNETDGVVGLGKKGEINKIKKAFSNSFKVVTAWENNQIVGAARMLSDGVCYA